MKTPLVEALRLIQAGRFAEALPIARRAAITSSFCSSAHSLLATALFSLGEREEAESVIVHALGLPDGRADAYDGLAFVSQQFGNHRRANQLYQRAVEAAPDVARHWYNLASSERSFGRLMAAEAACDRAIALDPLYYASYLLRADLRSQTDADNHIEQMQRLVARSMNVRANVIVGYALGKELDDLGRYDEAFHWFSHAARARRQHLQYDVGADERKLTRIAEVYALGTFPREATEGISSRYFFIVGLPRSGTTLVERILSGLPGIQSNGETENVSRALFSAASQHGGDVFARYAAADSEQVRQRYVALAGHTGAQRVIEKLPMNYLYLGGIRRALPHCTTFIVTRSTMDNCFAMFRTLFGEAYPFTYDFSDLARYLAAYRRLMEHWRALFGDQLNEVQYEDLVRSPAVVGAAMAKAGKIKWHHRASEVETNPLVSTTASASQVRRPVYQTSVGRWRLYERHLTPLIRALRSCNVDIT